MRDRVWPHFQTFENRVESFAHRRVFSTNLEVFGQTLFWVFDIHLSTQSKLKPGRWEGDGDESE